MGCCLHEKGGGSGSPHRMCGGAGEGSHPQPSASMSPALSVDGPVLDVSHTRSLPECRVFGVRPRGGGCWTPHSCSRPRDVPVCGYKKVIFLKTCVGTGFPGTRHLGELGAPGKAEGPRWCLWPQVSGSPIAPGCPGGLPVRLAVAVAVAGGSASRVRQTRSGFSEASRAPPVCWALCLVPGNHVGGPRLLRGSRGRLFLPLPAPGVPLFLGWRPVPPISASVVKCPSPAS